MFSLFQKPIGIQLSDTEVALVQLRARKEEPSFSQVLREPLPAGVVLDGKILNLEALTQVLAKLQKAVGSTDCVVALPINHIFMNVLRLPVGMEEAVIGPLVQKRLSSSIPFKAEELVVDQEALKDPVNNEEIVVLAAMEKVVFQTYNDAFEKAGWTGVKFLSGALALARSFPVPKKEHPYTFYVSPCSGGVALLFVLQDVLVDALVVPVDARDRMQEFFQQGTALLEMKAQDLFVSNVFNADPSFIPFLTSALGLQAHPFDGFEETQGLDLAVGSAYHWLAPVKKDRIVLTSLLQ